MLHATNFSISNYIFTQCNNYGEIKCAANDKITGTRLCVYLLMVTRLMSATIRFWHSEISTQFELDNARQLRDIRAKFYQLWINLL
jgi:hypothetical protein